MIETETLIKELESRGHKVLTSQSYGTWIVWGKSKGRFLSMDTGHMLVLARSGAEARKVWREHLYKCGGRDIPTECFARRVDTDRLGPRVLSDDVMFDLEIKLTTD